MGTNFAARNCPDELDVMSINAATGLVMKLVCYSDCEQLAGSANALFELQNNNKGSADMHLLLAFLQLHSFDLFAVTVMVGIYAV